MPFIEVFDAVEHSFYRGELQGVTGKSASVLFEGCEEPTKIETRYIRPEAKPAPEGFTPTLHSSVEVLFQLPGQAPSYWEGTVHNIIGGKALVKFPNPTYNDLFDFSVLRPATGLLACDCVFEFLPIPSDCHDDFMDHNKTGIDYVYNQSHLISLCFVPAKRALALYGIPGAVVEAKSLLSIVFAKSKQLNEGMKRLAHKSRSAPEQHASISFTIPTHLVGIAVGKEFKNIKELKRKLDLKEVTFDKLAEDESQTLVSVFADSKEKGELAKKHLNFVETIVEIKDRSHIRSIIGQHGSEITNMKEQTGVPIIQVKDKENPPHVVVAGLKDGVDQCIKMIEIICIYEPEFRSLEGELQGAGAARGGSQRYQNFMERQQRPPVNPAGRYSSEEFPALSAGQIASKQKQQASAAASKAVESAAAAPSRGGGKAGAGRGDAAAARVPAAEESAPAVEAAPAPRLRGSRGGRGARGRADSEHAAHGSDDAELPPPPAAAASDAMRGKSKAAPRGGKAARGGI
jgi:transcription antitermination factor NusA-like protein